MYKDIVENNTAEFKLSFQKEVIKYVVAFANSKGGNIFLGIADDGKTVGVELSSESIQNYINIIKQATQPSIIVDMDLIQKDRKNILEIQVDEYPIKPVSYKGRYHKRRSSSNHQMTPVEISNAYLKIINSSWDYFSDVNHNVSRFIGMANINYTIEDIYSKFELIKDGNITYGCYLLFNDNDASLFTNIEIDRFQTETLIKDSLSIDDGLINQVETVMNFIYKHINKAYVITGKPQKDEVWDYQMDAIREIVFNMIVHKDYQSNIHSIMKIFDDKIEFYNHGKLPEGLTIEDVKNGKYKSMPRNLQIADMFKTANIIEKYGSGIKRVIKLFKENGSKEPLFEERLGVMVVVAYRKDSFSEASLENTRDKIVILLKQNPKCTIPEMMDKMGKSRDTIKKHISRLKRDNIIQRIGSTKSGYWKLIDDSEGL